jgi:hypothetical protein
VKHKIVVRQDIKNVVYYHRRVKMKKKMIMAAVFALLPAAAFVRMEHSGINAVVNPLALPGDLNSLRSIS